MKLGKSLLAMLLMILIMPMMFAQPSTTVNKNETKGSLIDSETYFKGSEVRELINQIIPDEVPFRNEIIELANDFIDPDEYYKGADIISLIHDMFLIVWEESNTAVTETSEEAVKEAVVVLQADIAAKDWQIGQLNDEINNSRTWNVIIAIGGITIGFLSGLLLSRLLR